MAWTAPRTWVSGEIVTAANMNTHVRDNMKAAAGADKASCRAFHSGSQTINDTAATAVALNSEYFDTQAMHSTSTNTSRITIPTGWGGAYAMGGGIRWATSVTGTRWIIIQANGTLPLAQQNMRSDVTGGWQNDMAISTMTNFVAGDYIEVIALQTSGGGLAIEAASAFSPDFWAIWLGTG